MDQDLNKGEDGRSLQTIIFQKIKEKLAPGQELPQQLADVLGIGIHSAYRRLRNEIFLGIDELEKLVHHYELNFFDLVPESPSSYFFHGANLDANSKDYRNGLNKYVFYIENFKLAGVENLTYCGIDIMPLSLMGSPVMLAFQEYFWNYTLGNQNQQDGKLLSLENISPELIHLAGFFHEFLQSTPTTEIWSSLCLESILNQMVYLKETNRFASVKDLELVNGEIEKILNWTEIQASIGLKTNWVGKVIEPKTRFSMYISDLFFSDNNFFVQTRQQDFAVVKHNFFSYMFTYHPDFVELNRNIIQNIISKSQPVSAINEKGRITFFNNLRKRLLQSR